MLRMLAGPLCSNRARHPSIILLYSPNVGEKLSVGGEPYPNYHSFNNIILRIAARASRALKAHGLCSRHRSRRNILTRDRAVEDRELT